MDHTIYYVLGGLAVIYLLISIWNKRNAKQRRSRNFMDGYHPHSKKKD